MTVMKIRNKAELTATLAGIRLWRLEVRANWAILVTLGMSVKSMIRNQDSLTFSNSGPMSPNTTKLEFEAIMT